ncbi:MAG: effector-binding domain-containing protein [Bacteroidia bacterium]|jgi:effector-binding domain-containing protein
MKVLKVLGILLLVVVVIWLIASLILPKEMNVQVEETIEAPVSVVWGNLSTYEKADKWSPWYDIDPNMKVTFEGESGAVGSSMAWAGNKDVGSGTMTITASDMENHTIGHNVKHDFGEGNSKIVLTESEGKTTVSMSYVEKQGIPWNVMGALFGAEKMMTGMFKKELGLLKGIAEEEAAKVPEAVVYTVEEVQREAGKYVGKKGVVNMADMKTYFDANMPVLGALCKDNMIGAPAALYWTWDEENMQSEMTVAMPVDMEKAPEGYAFYEQPAGAYITVDYFGAYDEGMKAPHEALSAYMESNNMTMAGAVMEEYMTDPGTESDPTKWLTKISYPVTAAEATTED